MVDKKLEELTIEFLGAADGVVTGSKTLVSYNGINILVDYGLFQGPKDIRVLNYSKYGFEPKDIDILLLTHAHIDHSGLIPKLIKDGFKGKVLCTAMTKEISSILFKDAAYLMEKEFERKPYDKNRLPLYDDEDALNAINYFEEVNLDEKIEHKDFSFVFRESGHILGSSSVEIIVKGKKLYFTGDLGNENQILSEKIFVPTDVDYLITEATYGNRAHPKEDVEAKLCDSIKHIVDHDGVLVIPCFAVSRTQELLLNLYKYLSKNNAKIDIYLDSPMADKVTKLYMKKMSKKLDEENLDLIGFKKLYSVTETPLESKLLCEAKGPFVVLTASGMLMGGRVMHHLRSRISGKENALLFSGYQPPQSKGDLIKNGISHIKIFQDIFPVEARVDAIESLSAHADSNQILNWLKKSTYKKTKVLINHGTKESINALLFRIRKELNLEADFAKSKHIERIDLNKNKAMPGA
ncbi:MAG: MBL fold metallo-hydrolase [Bdellovibrionales bacterium]